MRTVLVRLLVVLAALLVLPGSAWGRDHFLCRMTGRVAPTCCCAAAKAVSAKRCEPGVRPSDCCERVHPGDGATATSAAAPQTIDPAVLTAIVPQPAYVVPSAPVLAFALRQGRGPPPPKRPLFVVHCAYLC